jgi:hypothetical protein
MPKLTLQSLLELTGKDGFYLSLDKKDERTMYALGFYAAAELFAIWHNGEQICGTRTNLKDVRAAVEREAGLANE